MFKVPPKSKSLERAHTKICEIPDLSTHPWCYTRDAGQEIRVLETLDGPFYINHVFYKNTNSENLKETLVLAKHSRILMAIKICLRAAF